MKVSETFPRSKWDIFFWPLLKILWEPFSRKNSHFWHWRETSLISTNKIIIPADINIKGRENLLSIFLATNFQTQKVILVKALSEDKFRVCTYGEEQSELKRNMCSVILDNIFGILPTIKDYECYAFSYPDNNPVSLEIIGETTKDRLDKNIVLI